MYLFITRGYKQYNLTQYNPRFLAGHPSFALLTLSLHKHYNIYAYSTPDSAEKYRNEKTWVLYSSLIPREGSRIALSQDKQLEIAHVERYCRKTSNTKRYKKGYNTPKVDALVAYLLGL